MVLQRDGAGAHVILKASSCTRLVVHSACWLGPPQLGPPAVPPTNGLFHVHWPSSQQGGWLPRTSVPRDPGGSCIAFYDLASAVISHHFRHGHGAVQIPEEET